LEKSKEKEKQISIILSKYIPLLKNNYRVHELKKEHLLKNKDHEDCFIIKEGTILARDEKGKTFTLEPGAPIGIAEALISKSYELDYFLKEDVTVFAFNSSNLRKAFAVSSSLTRGIIKYSLDRIFHNNKSKTYHLIDDGFISKQELSFLLKIIVMMKLFYEKSEAQIFFTLKRVKCNLYQNWIRL